MADPIQLTLQFSGGMELLFDNQKSVDVTLPAEYVSGQATMKELIAYVRDNLLVERPELFVQGDSVRPGILILINEADWELEGELEYVLQNGDTIVFISTLHGG
ncbi:ubiquitin-related modifier 1 [Polychytrium aggregatum]|uniref:ubiquitin-related modifier 1 n=1 Tax=Polychytrium aggregatum TaxID=110093 RepID=UPI0022FF0030|nr:ubiquitin-related modifier 1 [Polychytrium aggregatum]KAI9204584.1 ubiquitin-related modifier 1 [Polychytrium aggregatum]